MASPGCAHALRHRSFHVPLNYTTEVPTPQKEKINR
jgi:hypothetical protein